MLRYIYIGVAYNGKKMAEGSVIDLSVAMLCHFVELVHSLRRLRRLRSVTTIARRRQILNMLKTSTGAVTLGNSDARGETGAASGATGCDEVASKMGILSAATSSIAGAQIRRSPCIAVDELHHDIGWTFFLGYRRFYISRCLESGEFERNALTSISPRMFRAFEHAWLFNLYNAYINDAP